MTDTKITPFADIYPLIEETIRAGHTCTFTAYGNSMAPTIRGGKDRVTLSPIEGDIERYDIVFYRRDDGAFVLHRIIKIQKDNSFWLCGDNQYTIEKDIRRDQIIARLTLVERDQKIRYRRQGKGRFPFSGLRRFLIHIRNSLLDRLGFVR